MKRLSSKEALVDYLAEAISWRKAELARLDVLIQLAEDTDVANALCRAGAVMVCAHWEGYVKEAAQAYLNYVDCQALTFRELNEHLWATAMKGVIVKAGKSPKTSAHLELATLVRSEMDSASHIDWKRCIDTESNLSSAVFKEVLATIGLEYLPMYELRANFIDAEVLARRHAVAHGDRWPVNRSDYETLLAGVRTLLDAVRDHIEGAALDEAYRVA